MCKVYFYVWNELFHLLQVVFLEKYNPKFLPASWICCSCDFAKELDLCSVDLCTLLWGLESAEMPCSSGFYFFLFFLPFLLLFLLSFSLLCLCTVLAAIQDSEITVPGWFFYANFFNEMGMCFFHLRFLCVWWKAASVIFLLMIMPWGTLQSCWVLHVKLTVLME